MISTKSVHSLFKILYAATLAICLMGFPLFAASASSNTNIQAQGPAVRIFFSPTQVTLPPDGVLSLEIDADAYQIGFARIDLNFDPSMIQLTNEIQTTSLLGTEIQKTSMNAANSSGNITVVLGLRAGSTAPTGVFEFAQFAFRAVTASPSQNTTVSVVDQNVQLADLNATELPFVSESAGITLNSATATIFTDGFEGGNLSLWTSSLTDNGNLSVSTTAALVGSQGLKAVINDNNPIFVIDEHPNAEMLYRAGFFFDPNSITMSSGDTHLIFGGYSGPTNLALRLQFRKYSGNYQLQASLLDDGSTWRTSSWVTIGDTTHQIEFEWKAATSAGSNNGNLVLWIDGIQVADLRDVDNDTRRMDRVQLGAGSGIDSGTRGTYYFDEFKSSRGNVGAAPIIADFFANLTSGAAPLTVPFTNTSQPAESITGYVWDFGDGNTSTEMNPVHTYMSAGDYQVTLTAFRGSEQAAETKINYIYVLGDTTPPSVSWVAPTSDGQVYDVSDQTIQLGVSANDNVGIAQVVFTRWDYVNLASVEIGRVYGFPYQMDFDASTLLPGWNEINVNVYDNAGNLATTFIWLNHVTATNTGFLNAGSNASQTGGDGNGYQTNPTSAYLDDGLFAVDTNSGTNTNTSCTNSGKDKHRFYNFGISLPGSATIQGIEVRLDAKADSSSGTPVLCVQLSWNGGSSWTSVKSTGALTTGEQTFVLGGSADTWGRAWTGSELSNANFRVRIINVSSSASRDFSLDWITVRVTYK